MRFIDSKTHAIIDYMSGILFIASPWLFDFANDGAAKWVPIIIGIMVIVMSLMTRYEYGLIPTISLNAHLTVDIIAGLFLLASPWIFNFSDLVLWPHVIFGILEVGAGLLTEKKGQTNHASLKHDHT